MEHAVCVQEVVTVSLQPSQGGSSTKEFTFAWQVPWLEGRGLDRASKEGPAMLRHLYFSDRKVLDRFKSNDVMKAM